MWLFQQTGWEPGEAVTLGNLALTHWHLGELRTAAQQLADVIEQFHKLEAPTSEAMCRANLGELYLDLGRVEEAFDCLHGAGDAA